MLSRVESKPAGLLRLSSDVRRVCVRVASLLGSIAFTYFCLYGTAVGVELNAWMNHWVSRTNASALRAIGVDAFVDGDYIHTSTFSVYIVDRCNGLMALGLLVPACLTLAAPLRKRIVGGVGAIVLVCVLNQARLMTEMVYGSLYPASFAFVEEVVMRFFYGILFLSAFWIWAFTVTRKDTDEALS